MKVGVKVSIIFSLGLMPLFIEIPEAWMPTIKKQQQRGEEHRNSEDQNAPVTAAENQPLTVGHPV